MSSGQVNLFPFGHYYHAALQVADNFMKFLSGKKPQNCKLIVSAYDYESTPSVNELLNLVAQIRATGADIVKISTTAVDIVDASRMFQVLAHCQVSFSVSKFFSIPCHLVLTLSLGL
jgi:3-dehydroquinate dehydratase type I